MRYAFVFFWTFILLVSAIKPGNGYLRLEFGVIRCLRRDTYFLKNFLREIHRQSSNVGSTPDRQRTENKSELFCNAFTKNRGSPTPEQSTSI